MLLLLLCYDIVATFVDICYVCIITRSKQQLPNNKKTNLVEYLTQSVCFNHWSITELTQNQPSEIAIIRCMF